MSRTLVTRWAAHDAELTPGEHVRRSLPTREHRRIGPFVFCDHFGPGPAPSTPGVVAPEHPHVGLQTVTYVFSGRVHHRDSLGSDQHITPGDVNLMTAGAGIVHEEATISTPEPLEGLQLWVGLPHAVRHSDPSFAHVGLEQLPVFTLPRASVRVVMGSMNGLRSPVPTYQAVQLVDLQLEAGAVLELPAAQWGELGVYVAKGRLIIGEQAVAAFEYGLISDGASVRLHCDEDTRAIVMGGERLPEPTVIYWNFVTDTVAEARAYEEKWKSGGFGSL